MSPNYAPYALICIIAMLRVLIPFRPPTLWKDLTWWLALELAFVLAAHVDSHSSLLLQTGAFAAMAPYSWGVWQSWLALYRTARARRRDTE